MEGKNGGRLGDPETNLRNTVPLQYSQTSRFRVLCNVKLSIEIKDAVRDRLE